MFVLPLSRTAVRTPLARVVDESFDRFFVNAGAARSTSRVPALDVSETDTGYLVAFDVPGVTREQLKVTVEGRRVSLESIDAAPVVADAGAPDATGPAASAKVEAPRSLYRERSTARYARTLSLPAEVDQDASQARYENGVLTLTLAKKTRSGATQISIG